MKITICGDFCPTEVNRDLFAQGDIEAVFGSVTSVFKQSDRVIVNLECALTEHDVPIIKCGPNLKAPVQTAKTLFDAGVTDCSLSNNHTLDFGIKGLRDTIRALEDNNIYWTGVGENEDDSRRDHVINLNGKTISLISVCEHEYAYALCDRMGARPYDPYDTMEDIRSASEKSDYVFVLYHGGKEQCEYPSPRLRKLCRAMSKNGADVVLCQHSHCIGSYENYEDCHILYGQGNFHFIGHSDNPHWQSGLIVQLDITEKVDISFIPIIVTGAGIDLAQGEEREEILCAFDERSKTLENGEWQARWHEFCLQKAVSYKNVIANAFLKDSTERQNEMFSHYLDCEAHTDVWRELYPTWNHTNEK